jgi:hypothetical protein
MGRKFYVVATLTLGLRPRQGLARLRAKRKPGNEGKCEGMNLHTPKRAPTLGVWTPGEFRWIEEFLISLESY